jgi:small subunit ribosomal protein S2
LIAKYNGLKEQQANGELERYTKKEQLEISKKLTKMDKTLAGLAGLKKMPDVIFVPSMQREKTAVTEANKMDVKVVAICDTNANPLKADHFIPANDDAVKAIKMMVALVSDAAKAGKTELDKKKMAEKSATEKKAVSKNIKNNK